MRARTSALALASAIAAGSAFATLMLPAAASAAPESANYPAPPPALMVNASSVSTGNAVRLRGASFGAGEPITIRVRYRMNRHSGSFGTEFNPWVGGPCRADDQGNVKARIALTSPGFATIRVTGLRSHKTATVTVRVLAWGGNSWGGNWNGGGGGSPWPDIFQGTPLAGGPFGPQPGPWGGRVNQAHTESLGQGATDITPPQPAGADLVVGLLGLAALAGSGFVGRRRRPGTEA